MLALWAGGVDCIRSIRTRFAGNVFANEHVTAGGSVVATEAVGDGVLAHCDVWLDTADGRRVLAWTASVMLQG
jgi:hypothetical protein